MGSDVPRSSKTDFTAKIAALAFSEDCCLGIQRVEDGFDQDQIRATVHQAARRLGIVRHQFVEGDVARRRVVHVGRNGRRLVGGPQHAGDEARLVRRRKLVARFTRHPRTGHVQLVIEFGHAVGFQRGRIRAEGIGLDDVRARFQIFAVDGFDDFGLGQHQQIVVALEVAVPVGKTLAAIIRLGQLVALDHGAHRAVQDENALLQELFDAVGYFVHGFNIRCR